MRVKSRTTCALQRLIVESAALTISQLSGTNPILNAEQMAAVWIVESLARLDVAGGSEGEKIILALGLIYTAEDWVARRTAEGN